ncbi:hypothetical protein [Plantactinospora sp. WMMB782]|uniref:hypothetical protein n=1 Tax=Plantactinospora sp. WMMB782 TaxID=3404121 RepID=UPI003B94923B
MTDYWGGWSADQPDFDGPPDGVPDDADLGGLAPDSSDVDYPVEGFGDADPDPGFGETDPGSGGDPPSPLGYDDLPVGPADDPYAETDPYPAEESGFGPAGDPEVPAEAGFGAADPPVGADPDLHPYADAGPVWWAPAGPAEFGEPPEPVDGFPWADPALLGQPVDAAVPPPPAADAGSVDPAGLAGYAGEELPADGDAWTALTASDDPATSTLARFWLPDER